MIDLSICKGALGCVCVMKSHSWGAAAVMSGFGRLVSSPLALSLSSVWGLLNNVPLEV